VGVDKGWDKEAERALWADICMDDLWWFVNRAFGVTNPGNVKGGWLCERIHRPITEWFQTHVKEWIIARRAGQHTQKNLFIVVPREFGKSVVITKAGSLWLQLQDPELSEYIGSITKEMAIEFLDPIKQVLKGQDEYQWFTWLYGSWYDKDRDWTAESVEHAIRKGTAVGEPSFGVWGAATGLTGKHPDVIVFDDPISYPRMETHTGWVDYVNRHVTALIPVLKGDGLRIFIGTRYHDGDWIGRALHKHGARTITGMPIDGVEAREDGIWHFYFLAARDKDGSPIFPEQWPDARLREYEHDNAIEYYAQMLNDPTSEKTMDLSRRQVDQMWVEKKDLPGNLRISVHLDTAFKYNERKMHGDESVITVWGHTRDGSGSVYYLEGYSSNSWRAEDFNNRLTHVLKSLRSRAAWPYIVTDEVELGGKQGTWELTIVNWCASAGLPPPNIKLLSRAGKSKLSRQRAAASFWVDGRVKLVIGAPGVDRLVDQMLKIGVSQHDDWSDSAADVFHPEVYKPMRLTFSDDDVALARPYDAQLQDGTLSPRRELGEMLKERRSLREEMAQWKAIGEHLY
jgi:hypothetical protein